MEIPKNPPPSHTVDLFERTGETLSEKEMGNNELKTVVAGTDLIRGQILPTRNLPTSGESLGISPSPNAPGTENVSDIGHQFLGHGE